MMESTQFCCQELALMAREPESPLQYEPEKRRFRIWSPAPAFRKKNQIIFVYDIFYCPKCGKELPEDLAKEWADIIKEKFDVDNVVDPKQLARLSPEYLTEEWWKKAGL